jgi:hypothetical protein
MKVNPYTITYGGRTEHYCRVVLDDGSSLDMFSAGELKEEEWEEIGKKQEAMILAEKAALEKAAITPEAPAPVKDSKTLIQESIAACYAEKLIAAPTLDAFKVLVSKMASQVIEVPEGETLVVEKP